MEISNEEAELLIDRKPSLPSCKWQCGLWDALLTLLRTRESTLMHTHVLLGRQECCRLSAVL